VSQRSTPCCSSPSTCALFWPLSCVKSEQTWIRKC
jgi:hypothetical protein